MKTDYMYRNHWTDQYREMFMSCYESKELPKIKTVPEGTVLPTRPDSLLSWGRGGVLDSRGEFVPESGVGTNAFGGAYEIAEESIDYLDQPIIYIGIVPRHWGHFLIDSVCRLWPFLWDEYKDHKVAFCGWGWTDEHISGNYRQMFELLGIPKANLIFVSKPLKAKMIIIPEPTMGYSSFYHAYYKDIINKIAENALARPECGKLSVKKKIYFTRTQFMKSRFYEVGEKEVECAFGDAGFEIVAPEKSSLLEQIFYIRNCDAMASLSGTIPHNAIFAKEGMSLIILNRTCVTNPPQVRINRLFNVDWIYIDIYSDWTLKHPMSYGDGPVKVEVNDNLRKFFSDNNWQEPRRNLAGNFIISIKNQIHFYALIIFRILKNSTILKTNYQNIKQYYIKNRG